MFTFKLGRFTARLTTVLTRYSSTSSGSPLVSTEWLAQQLSNNSSAVCVLDGSWYMKAEARDTKAEFVDKHIPTAAFFSVEDCTDKQSKLPHMLPSPGQFADYVSERGVSNSSHVIVYDSDVKHGMFSAQRVWWMFRVFGHDHVSVLSGGLQKWIKENRQLESGEVRKQKTSFQSNYQPELVSNMDDVISGLASSESQILDARSKGRFDGTAPESRKGMPSGHMVGSINIPFPSVMDPDTHELRSEAELRQMFEEKGVDLNKPIQLSCGSAITAGHLALALYSCGVRTVPIYDGSWSEMSLHGPDKHVKRVYHDN